MKRKYLQNLIMKPVLWSVQLFCFRTKLSGTVQSIKRQSIELKDASHLLNENAENMSTTIYIEGAVTDIANNATTQADKTQTATANVVDIGTMISATSEQINDISNNTSQIRVF